MGADLKSNLKASVVLVSCVVGTLSGSFGLVLLIEWLAR